MVLRCQGSCLFWVKYSMRSRNAWSDEINQRLILAHHRTPVDLEPHWARAMISTSLFLCSAYHEVYTTKFDNLLHLFGLQLLSEAYNLYVRYNM